jgi:EpsI family protein
VTRLVHVLVVALSLLAAGGAAAARSWRDRHAISAADAASLPRRIEGIPLEFGDFRGKPHSIEDVIVRESGAEAAASAMYTAGDGGAVRLYVGGSAKRGGYFHTPNVCLPMGGWEVIAEEDVPFFDVEGRPPGARIRRLHVRQGAQRLLAYYWVQTGPDVMVDLSDRVRHRFGELLRGERARPIYIVALYAPVAESVKETEDTVLSFVRASWPTLRPLLSHEQ